MPDQYRDLNQVYYEDYYQFPGRSRWMDRIWAEAFGDQYPAGLDHYGYLTRHDLETFTRRIDLQPGGTLLDIGCGKGGPGLWLAQQLQLRLIGIDLIPGAIDQAMTFQSQFELAHPATFLVGEFYKIPLPDQSVDAVICIDSLWAAPNKVQALMEIKRVMKPGARFFFTYWDLLSYDPVAAFEISGLKFVDREETPDWKTYQQRVYEGIKAHQEALIEEMDVSANMLLYEAQASPEYLDLSVRRIYELQRPSDS